MLLFDFQIHQNYIVLNLYSDNQENVKQSLLALEQMGYDLRKQSPIRILIVDKNNSGVSATRNIGLRLAKGEYLQFVDSDDYLTEEATRLMVEAAQRSQADMVFQQVKLNELLPLVLDETEQ